MVPGRLKVTFFCSLFFTLLLIDCMIARTFQFKHYTFRKKNRLVRSRTADFHLPSGGHHFFHKIFLYIKGGHYFAQMESARHQREENALLGDVWDISASREGKNWREIRSFWKDVREGIPLVKGDGRWKDGKCVGQDFNSHQTNIIIFPG